MYQTPQGVVYATGAAAAGAVNVPEALLLNYQTAHQSKPKQSIKGGVGRGRPEGREMHNFWESVGEFI